MEKHFISADELLRDSFRLAEKVYLGGYKPDLIVGLWRGGSPIAIAVHEYFTVLGFRADHYPLRTSSYTGMAEQESHVRIEGLQLVCERINSTTKLLLVDDVFDTGRSLQAVLESIKQELPSDKAPEIRTACVWHKPTSRLTDAPLDFYLNETDKWLVFPHELAGLSIDEITLSKPEIVDLLVPYLRRNKLADKEL